jgi:hypothetical protein
MELQMPADAPLLAASDLVAYRDLSLRLAIDLACVLVLIRGIYFRTYQRADLFLTFFAFNLVIFLITYALNQVNFTMGAAFGLFAVFSMLRYRTEGISANDMTYLFLVIALGMLMSISRGSAVVLGALGALVLLFTLFLESGVLARRELTQRIQYDNVTLLPTNAREALLADLRTRTGRPVHRVEVHEIDFLRDSANLTIYYHPTSTDGGAT